MGIAIDEPLVIGRRGACIEVDAPFAHGFSEQAEGVICGAAGTKLIQDVSYSVGRSAVDVQVR